MLSFGLNIATIMACTWSLTLEVNRWQSNSKFFVIIDLALIAMAIRTLSLLVVK